MPKLALMCTNERLRAFLSSKLQDLFLRRAVYISNLGQRCRLASPLDDNVDHSALTDFTCEMLGFSPSSAFIIKVHHHCHCLHNSCRKYIIHIMLEFLSIRSRFLRRAAAAAAILNAE